MRRGMTIFILGVFSMVFIIGSVSAESPQGISMKNARFLEGSCNNITNFVGGSYWFSLEIQDMEEVQGVQQGIGWVGSTTLESGLSGSMSVFMVKSITSSSVGTPFESEIRLTNSDAEYYGIITGYILTDGYGNHRIKGSITLFDETSKSKSFTGDVMIVIRQDLNSCIFDIRGVQYNSELITGIQGPKGDKGDTGSQGLQGIQGPKGDMGLQGPKGDKGDTGSQGLQGIQGPKGDMGWLIW